MSADFSWTRTLMDFHSKRKSKDISSTLSEKIADIGPEKRTAHRLTSQFAFDAFFAIFL